MHPLHAKVVRLVLLALLLLLHAREEPRVFAQLADGALALLLVLVAQLGRLVALVVGVLAAQVRRRGRLELGDVGWNGDGLVGLELKRFARLLRKFEQPAKRVR